MTKQKSLSDVERLFLFVQTDLLVHLELRVAVLEEGVDLLGGSDTGVDVGLGCLSTHLLRG